jgi:hypothetical protein
MRSSSESGNFATIRSTANGLSLRKWLPCATATATLGFAFSVPLAYSLKEFDRQCQIASLLEDTAEIGYPIA